MEKGPKVGLLDVFLVKQQEHEWKTSRQEQRQRKETRVWPRSYIACSRVGKKPLVVQSGGDIIALPLWKDHDSYVTKSPLRGDSGSARPPRGHCKERWRGITEAVMTTLCYAGGEEVDPYFSLGPAEWKISWTQPMEKSRRLEGYKRGAQSNGWDPGYEFHGFCCSTYSVSLS